MGLFRNNDFKPSDSIFTKYNEETKKDEVTENVDEKNNLMPKNLYRITFTSGRAVDIIGTSLIFDDNESEDWIIYDGVYEDENPTNISYNLNDYDDDDFSDNIKMVISSSNFESCLIIKQNLTNEEITEFKNNNINLA